MGNSSDTRNNDDLALAIAKEQLRWYDRHRRLSMIAYAACQVLLLLSTAATTMAAALKAIQWVTASLAAFSLIVAGLLRIFDWHDTWVEFSSSWALLNASINKYRLLSPDQRNQDAQKELIQTVDDLIIGDTRSWANRARNVPDKHKS